ncbi:TIGR02587 family membrane protein [Pelagibacterium montanilacus]|uniref:TIGR02587 family membrane protein n=1 Tax=Pelagibacterium montanilacus TaxID=2185280 RepID=UPI000F8D9B23
MREHILSENTSTHETESTRSLLIGVGRAFGGALIFAMPMLMTMEMWSLGFSLDPWRIAALLIVTLPLLLGLSRFGGFRPTTRLRDDIADVFVAVVVAAFASGASLFLFGLLEFGMSPREIMGKIAVQLVPASIGAMLGRSQLGGRTEATEVQNQNPSYWSELFIMGVGALFLSLNVAPTEEMVLIAYKMSVWHQVTMVVLSLVLMHAFVYTLDFRGGTSLEGKSTLGTFVRFTFGGYAVVLLVSLGTLWLFGRTDGTSLAAIISSTVVLAFPGAIGAAAARLVL